MREYVSPFQTPQEYMAEHGINGMSGEAPICQWYKMRERFAKAEHGSAEADKCMVEMLTAVTMDNPPDSRISARLDRTKKTKVKQDQVTRYDKWGYAQPPMAIKAAIILGVVSLALCIAALTLGAI